MKKHNEMINVNKKSLSWVLFQSMMVVASPPQKSFIVKERDVETSKFFKEYTWKGKKLKLPTPRGWFWIILIILLFIAIGLLMKELI